LKEVEVKRAREMQDDNAIFGQFTWNFRPDESDVSFDPDPENKDHGSSPPRYIAHKCVGNVIRNYLGVTGVDLIDSPVAVLRVHNRGCWDSLKHCNTRKTTESYISAIVYLTSLRTH
jgi:hypothetical protein